MSEKRQLTADEHSSSLHFRPFSITDSLLPLLLFIYVRPKARSNASRQHGEKEAVRVSKGEYKNAYARNKERPQPSADHSPRPQRPKAQSTKSRIRPLVICLQFEILSLYSQVFLRTYPDQRKTNRSQLRPRDPGPRTRSRPESPETTDNRPAPNADFTYMLECLFQIYSAWTCTPRLL